MLSADVSEARSRLCHWSAEAACTRSAGGHEGHGCDAQHGRSQAHHAWSHDYIVEDPMHVPAGAWGLDQNKYDCQGNAVYYRNWLRCALATDCFGSLLIVLIWQDASQVLPSWRTGQGWKGEKCPPDLASPAIRLFGTGYQKAAKAIPLNECRPRPRRLLIILSI